MSQRRTSRHLPAPKGARRAKVKVVVAGDHDKVQVAVDTPHDYGLERIVAIGCVAVVVMTGTLLCVGAVLVSLGVIKLG